MGHRAGLSNNPIRFATISNISYFFNGWSGPSSSPSVGLVSVSQCLLQVSAIIWQASITDERGNNDCYMRIRYLIEFPRNAIF